MPFQMKKSNPSVSTHSQLNILMHQHTHIPAFLPNTALAQRSPFPGSIPPWLVPYPSILPPLPAPLPAPSRHPHPLSTGKHIFFHIHHVEVGCAFWCQNTHGRPRQQRLHGCTELLLCWLIAVGFCGMVLAVPGVVGRSQELVLAVNTDLLKLVWYQVSRSLLGHLSVCPLSPCCGPFLCFQR